mmetsp:Transcript_7335/g.13585  ORF Transcript_7335/g.13585 Transcript_7335/m.13585 type:complete len:219 (+) Transcript_7335:44-700(+)
MNHRQVTLVDALFREGVLVTPRVAEVMKAVDRVNFVRRQDSSAYADCPQYLGFGATISAPHMHAYALEWLQQHIVPNSTVLDVGSGSGYLTACFALMLEGQGKVYGVEHIPELVDFAIHNLERSFPAMLRDGLVEIVAGDGRLGLPDHGPYNAIHVGAASSVIPQALIDQLAPGGRMVIPVGEQGETQAIYFVDKDHSGKLRKTKTLAVSSREAQARN